MTGKNFWKKWMIAIMSKNRPYREPRMRTYKGVCENCGAKKMPNEVFIYVDGNNFGITNNSPYLCRECYEKKYKTKQKG